MKKLILNEETVKQLDRIVRLYITDTNVRAVFIINTAGQVMFHRGMTKSDYFVQSIGALASGIFNATNGLAKLLGSKYFNAAPCTLSYPLIIFLELAVPHKFFCRDPKPQSCP